MANTQSLRRRIKTAQNVSKTTRAMQMIAASKLKRAQEAVFASRPYVQKLIEMSQKLVPSSKQPAETLHPYIQKQETTGSTLYIVISPDKGLCGSLITNLIREYLKYNIDSSFFITIGKKIEHTISITNKHLVASFPFGLTLPSFEMVYPLKQLIDEYYLSNQVDSVKILTTSFVNVFTQTPVVTTLLPLQFDEEKNARNDILFEPSKALLLPELLNRYLEMVLYQHMLESYASEQASRMLAMQNATNNAKDIVTALRLLYNKARQEKITNEILDISSASNALEEKA